jgi:hypothetical protein
LLPFLVRLACVKRAASVDSEPGSNSRLICLSLDRLGLTRIQRTVCFASNQIFKDLGNRTEDPEGSPADRRPQSRNDRTSPRSVSGAETSTAKELC